MVVGVKIESLTICVDALHQISGDANRFEVLGNLFGFIQLIANN